MLTRLKVANENLRSANVAVRSQIAEESFQKECDAILEYEDKAASAVAVIEQYLKRYRNVPDTSATTQRQSEVTQNEGNRSVKSDNIKLPRLELKKFNGNLTDWIPFWQQFSTAIHENANIDDVAKFNYLQTVLTGKAANTIVGLTPSSKCYNDAIALLKDEYGSTDRIVDNYIQKLLTLSAIKSRNDVTGLRALYNNISSISRSLNALDLPTSQYSMMIRSVVLKSLPWAMRTDFHRLENYKPVPENANDSSSNDNSSNHSFSNGASVSTNAETQVKLLINFIKREVDSMEKAVASGFNTINDNKNDSRPNAKDSSNKTNQCTAAGLFTSNVLESCLFCNNKTHATISCNVSQPIEKKKAILKEHSRCFRCTRPKHSSNNCKTSNLKCDKCKGRHATVMCDPEYKKRLNEIRSKENTGCTQDKAIGASTSRTTTELLADNRLGDIYLQTARGIVSSTSNSSQILVRLVLDGGSQLTFIKESISRQLNLPIVGTERISVITFGATNKTPGQLCNLVSLNLKSQHTNKAVNISAVEVPEICLDTLKIPKIQNPKFQHLKLADTEIGTLQLAEGIGLLVGADNYWSIVTGETKRLSENLTAISTVLGWTLHGRNLTEYVNVGLTVTTTLHAVATDCDDINDNITPKFWNIEMLGISGEPTKDNNLFSTDEYIDKSIAYTGGRYEAKLPWKIDNVFLNDNYINSLTRLKSLTTRLINNGLLERYDQAMREYIVNGIAEPVLNNDTPKQNVYYMPHRPVIRDDKTTTKMRVVFDASAHSPNCTSLNDLLEVGENLVPDLISVLLNFRKGHIGIIADIEKAFLQIVLAEENRDTHRFLWYTETPKCKTDFQKDVQVYRMKRITFGVTSSPFILSATIKKHLNANLTDYNDSVNILRKSFYIDDLVTSVDNFEQATTLFSEAKLIMSNAGMNLRKWNSNDPNLCQNFDETNLNFEKVLGINWCTQTDVLYVDIEGVVQFIKTLTIGTKRNVLQSIARIFDPLGFIMPFTITLKILLQTLWKLNVPWDEPLPDETMKIWSSWCKDLAALQFYSVPRPFSNLKDSDCQLHIFADASPQAYGVVAYLRTSDENYVRISFINSKARVAPLNPKNTNLLTLPRLELTAALMAARLQKYLIDNLSNYFNRVCLWSDSKIALFWMKGNPNKWKPYVANRVREINELTSHNQWFYCEGKSNPADFLTRGISSKRLLKNDTWLCGPEWLKKHETYWPNKEIEDANPAVLNMFIVNKPNSTYEKCYLPIYPVDKVSDANKLLRITAYILRFVHNLRHPNKKNVGVISANEFNAAEEHWIKYVQSEHFASEIFSLKNRKQVDKTSKLLTLSPFLDSNDILRLGGRLEQSSFAYGVKHPIILPKRSFLTELLIRKEHTQNHHAGVGTVLTKLRQKYWILSGRQIVKSTLSSCVICKRLRAKAADEPFAPLPAERLEAVKPFEATGVDFAGPFYIKNNKEERIKAYLMLLTCAAVRAVHLELVPDLSADNCLLALRRFISRRGLPKTIYSDNAKTFKKVASDLKQLAEFLESDKLKSFTQNQRIDWHFIVERAAWWGGWWERLIRSVKTSLKAVLGRNSFNFVELQTILTEIEASINARPLTYLSNDPTNLDPLTPSHFLLGPRHHVLAAPVKGNNSLEHQWKERERILLHFWRRWSNEYVLQLRSAHHNVSRSSSNVKVNDVMLLHDTTTNRMLWKLVRVDKVFPGRDGRVRACEIVTSDGNRLRRPVQLSLELSADPSSHSSPAGGC